MVRVESGEAAMASLKSNPVVQRLVQSGEAQVTKVVQLVLANEKFLGTVQSLVQTSLAAKGTFDKSVRAALGAMSLPSRDDLDALNERVAALESVISQFEEQLAELTPKPAAKTKRRTRASGA
jgi:hypothetical protein